MHIIDMQITWVSNCAKLDTCNWKPLDLANYVTNKRVESPITIGNFLIDTMNRVVYHDDERVKYDIQSILLTLESLFAFFVLFLVLKDGAYFC